MYFYEGNRSYNKKYRFVLKFSLLGTQFPYVGVSVSPVTHKQAGHHTDLLGKPFNNLIAQKRGINIKSIPC